jgi:hypothetical protein
MGQQPSFTTLAFNQILSHNTTPEGAVFSDTCNKEAISTDRVASGRCRPEAPTDPYVLALEHTVLQIMGSLPSGTQRGYPFLFR